MADQLKWTITFPGKPGWYWVYRALPHMAGENFTPEWIELPQSLPAYAKAFYGPIEAPEMPLDLRPVEYQEKIKEELAAKDKTEDEEGGRQQQ